MENPTRDFLFMYGIADGERHPVPIDPDGSPAVGYMRIREKISPMYSGDRHYSRTVSLEMDRVKTQDYRPLMFVVDGVKDWIFIAV
jgi:hypothetical protein